MINEKLQRIQSDLAKARKKLGRLAEMERGNWVNLNKVKRALYKASFIWAKKKYVQDLIDRWPNNMDVIKVQSNNGWQQQRRRLTREIAHMTPYHTQVAHLLVEIAMRNLKDTDTLRTCCQVVRDEITVFLDLDLFDAFTAETEDQLVERIAQAHEVGHLRLELLLREANRQQAELTRVVVERVFTDAVPESRIVDAFRAILGTLECTPYFASNATTLFCLSKFRRPGDPCSRLQQSMREVPC
ncbi:hypothetical protein A1O3_04336 [Capronia epimyces CBS 606.96]|uniref:Uncharacterized protein n=1 Tax=Capronia epimyces CBS 606.96 TaxID=1182542 RepID=W9Y3L4_9EURO|nr:uncharacterized protein A1O3_04336 [Capronia epimyces CBS 606.96]EXJ87377.1 hypothetical protein A1O3_04336 [Capronia epimyces CBS 606.96]